MKATEVKFVRKYNVGQYESEEYGVTAQVEDGDTVTGCLISMKSSVADAYAGIGATETTEAPKNEEEVQETKDTKKKAKKKKEKVEDETDNSNDENTDSEDPSDETAGNDGEGDQDDEATDDQGSDDNNDHSEDADDEGGDDEESDDSEESKAPARKSSGGSKAEKSEKESGKKSFRKKPQDYNRGNEQHKEIFSGVLRAVAPDWKKSEISKKKARAVSEKMEGENFLDDKGEVLADFKAQVKKLMAAKK